MAEKISVHLQIKPCRCTYINVISRAKKSGKAAIRYRKLKLHKNKQIDVGLQCTLGHCLISVSQSHIGKERYAQSGFLAFKNLNPVYAKPYLHLSSIRQDHTMYDQRVV